MKKTLLLSVIFLALLSVFKPEKTDAQVTGITVYVNDSLFDHCHIPSLSPISVYGTLSGTMTATNDSLSIYVNYGDGTDTTFITVPSGTGTSAYFYNTLFHVYSIPGTYAPYFTATAISSGVVGSGSDFSFTLSNTCGTIQGQMYVDANSNCVDDAGDVNLNSFPIWVVDQATNDTFFGAWTVDSGYYSMNLPAGNYNILTNPYTYYGYWFTGAAASDLAPSCPASGVYSIAVTSSTSTTQNFGFVCATPASYDISVNGWDYELVKGDTTAVSVYVGNWWWYTDYTCETLSSIVTLTLDAHLHYAGMPSGYALPTVSGSTLTWNITSSADMFDFWSYVLVYVDTSAVIGDTLCSTISVTPTVLADPDLTNNTVTLCGQVLASWDPNEMAVSPQGTGTPGYIANQTALTYQVHFQNTGSAPAQNITVVDTLGSNIDMATLHVLRSSAPVDILASGNVVKFHFGNINLPDSAANPMGSIGIIVFGVTPKQSLAPGAQMPNKASIYFDYNPAVVTNSVLNTINDPLSVQHLQSPAMSATVYPNPATEQVFAKTNDHSEFTITLTDMLGRSLASSKSLNGAGSVNTLTIPSGLYLVTLTNTAGKTLTTKVTIQH